MFLSWSLVQAVREKGQNLMPTPAWPVGYVGEEGGVLCSW